MNDVYRGFAGALRHVLEMEGGWTNDPFDPGGPTNFGITLKDFALATKRTIEAGSVEPLKAELRGIGGSQVEAIYRTAYWQPAGCEGLPEALAFMVFDTAVNQGVGLAIRLLQAAVGAGVDGVIGPETMARAQAADIATMLQAIAQARRRRYQALATFPRFGRGWLRRVDTTLARARALVPADTSVDTVNHQKGRLMNDVTEAPAATAPVTAKAQAQATAAGGAAAAVAPATAALRTAKWWGQSVTVWGTAITALATVLPVIGPIIGIDVSADMVRVIGAQALATGQAVAGLIGTMLAIYGRTRASQPLSLRTFVVRM